MKLLDSHQIKKLESLMDQYFGYEEQLATMIPSQNLTQYRKISKKKAQIKPQVKLYSKYQTLKKQILELEKTAQQTPALKELADIEIRSLQRKMMDITTKLNQVSHPQPNSNLKNSMIIEINGATGGEEANIFASDLFRMYTRYAERQNWTVKVITSQLTEAGGIDSLTFKISGRNVAHQLQFEGGGHRVQRVPKTEHKGRIHTSVATVAVLPEADPVVVNLQSKDLRIDTYRSSSAGGQHVNVTDSAVRITHLPTGIVATSQDGRSQHDNRSLAMEHLRAKIFDFLKNQQQAKTNQIRKQATGTGRRNEKIRTYNFPQNRLTDHRINRSWKTLTTIMDGHLDDVISALIQQQEKIENE